MNLLLISYYLFTIRSSPVYTFNDATKTLTISSCPSSDSTCSIIKSEFQNSGAFTTYKTIQIDFGPKSIGDGAFGDCSLLEEIYLSTSIETISTPFCRLCPLLKKIEVNESPFFETDSFGSLYSIGRKTLIRAPSAITSIQIAEETEILSAQAFWGSKVESLLIPRNVKEINVGCFYDGNILTISFEEGSILTTLGKSALAIQGSLHTLELPSSLVTLGELSLYRCRKLETLSFGANPSLAEIQTEAFKECLKLKSVILPESVHTIGENAFASCSSLTSLYLSKSLVNLSTTFLSGCTSFADISISAENTNFKSISGSLFDYSETKVYVIPTACETFEIPDSLLEIGQTALQLCPNLVQLIISETHPRFVQNSKILIDRDNNQILAFVGGIDSISIPDNVNSLGPYCGAYLSSISNIEVIEGITILDNYCFTQSSIQTISLPSTLKSININAFESCSSLISISFPETGSIKILDYAFQFCSKLSIVDFKCNITSVGYKLFNGASVTEIYFRKNGLITTSTYTFASTKKLSIVEFPESLTTLASNLFDSSSVERITFPYGSSVSLVSKNALKNCNNLKLIELGNKLQTLESECFSGCTSLESLTFDDECPMTEITSSGIFFECQSLKTLTLPRNIVRIDPMIFSNCILLTGVIASANSLSMKSKDGILYSSEGSLQLLLCPQGKITVEVAEGVTVLGERCFYGCAILNTILFPSSSSFPSLPSRVFSGCTLLRQLIVPPSVETIASDAFDGCESLAHVVFDDESKLKTIEDGAFASLGMLESINLEVCTLLSAVPPRCFQGCISLSSLSLPTDISSIGEAALSGCSSIGGNFVIPASISFVGEMALDGTSIRHVQYCGTNFLNNAAFASNYVQYVHVHVVMRYPETTCLGSTVERDLDGECIIQTPEIPHILTSSLVLIQQVVCDDDTE